VLIAGVLPLFLIRFNHPLWIYFTGESFFISTLLKLAEVQNDDLAVWHDGFAATPDTPAGDPLSPGGAVCLRYLAGMSVTRQVRQKQILSRPWRTAFATLQSQC
jgi:hypothetical protein